MNSSSSGGRAELKISYRGDCKERTNLKSCSCVAKCEVFGANCILLAFKCWLLKTFDLDCCSLLIVYAAKCKSNLSNCKLRVSFCCILDFVVAVHKTDTVELFALMMAKISSLVTIQVCYTVQLVRIRIMAICSESWAHQ